MWVAKTKSEFIEKRKTLPYPIVLVPTMGALHSGHEALIRLAREKAGTAGTVLVSIFVNPIQFDRKSDLENYPRPIEDDLSICQTNHADGVFIPENHEMYFADRSTAVIESKLSKHLCGATRPGHFDGVCTVVLKLFNLTGCHSAVFGEKDFQQLTIIRRMIRDLDLSVQIIEHPTVRESDGLALSSRNKLLKQEHRGDAPRIRKALLSASKYQNAEQILDSTRTELQKSPYGKIDYLSLVDSESLEPVDSLTKPSVLACAIFYGEVRLIDHIQVPPIPQ
ncbi:MAG: pantoate--beta-alanine ligase [Akkermansiaceae bacterium]